MKKTVLTLLLIVSFVSTYGQNKWQKQQNQTFVMSFKESNQAAKDGKITQEEKKAKNKESSKEFKAELTQITGKTYKEMEPWINKMRQEMKKK